MASDCVFCKIVAGEIPAEIVAESDQTIAFRDINPKAPVHVLVIPREHQPDIASLAAASPTVAAEMLEQSRVVARQEGYEDYNLVFNTGADAGQTVFHAHAHVLAGVDVAKLFLA
ncbi:histidine triad nucleotide-binding protein [Aeromicrobium camelliae]|uniref:Histidine triad nucleotide-binding protein n=1 Tax=Aeromicrobium camelliae TaxID=1538144 RepID=A0A3N6WRQ5_9ACTN|nr:histidine triad nucleotide-binding protein [Aeromicrobium camelliae]RQN10136.1 histidine triad nucleotide-binding protein [Aeromicrobium camelliae]